MDSPTLEQIQIFNNLFKGREDVFAIRWEKESKSGYMPAYYFDRYSLRAHKMKGGTFQNYNDKSYLKLTEKEIAKHLNGEQLIGVYPLLTDNTSWFLVADFDKENWIEECRKFISECSVRRIPAYLERSRSGNGGHVWIFFEQNYPAIKSRKIFISMLENSGLFSRFDKSLSFDRVFPNQDLLAGKGLGNLIALPLFKKTYEIGNSCFIDPITLSPIDNQWQFLEDIKRISIEQLEQLYQEFSNASENFHNDYNTGKLSIELNNTVKISRIGLTLPLINYLKQELNFANTEYIIKKKIGKGTFGTDRYFKSIEETEKELIIPRGFIGKLIRFCRENKIEHDFIDNRKKRIDIFFDFNVQLRAYQQAIVDTILKKDFGVIVAPPGSGKTIIGLKIIASKQQPALIIVHRKQLLEQWTERIESFLGIPKNEIGKIGSGKNKIGNRITVATIQSLVKVLGNIKGADFANSFGMVIVDECHHIPAESFRNVITKLNTYYLYGLTATPIRKYNDGRLIFIHLGDIIAEIKSTELTNSGKAKIIIRNTELDIPFNPKTDRFETISKILIHDSARNKLILEDVKIELNSGKRVVIITERKEHIESLTQYLKQSYETITLSGEDSETSRNSKWKILREGNYQVLITTGQYFGEGADLQNANCLFLIYPFSFEGKLIQYIGRVQRSEVTPTIYDYRDYKIPYLNKLFLKRNLHYRKIDKQATLFDDPVDIPDHSKKVIIIEKTINVPFEKLEFQYGSVSFKYAVEELNCEIEFDIENIDIRPEFEVLKPYISKVLHARKVKVLIQAEFEDGKLISQLATSKDIEKISREIIEGVKFKFISKNFITGKFHPDKEGLLTIDQTPMGELSLYNSEIELLEDILGAANYKHARQLRFLASKHFGDLMKIRFVLKPFSFVFLLSGKVNYHIVLETLDTEEATYIWHIQKTKQSLKKAVIEIEIDLQLISSKGRLAFLDMQPNYFSRVNHEYTDEKKGFVIWKDLLEAHLN